MPPPHPAAVAKQDTVPAIVAEAPNLQSTRPAPPVLPARKAVPVDASWQPLIVLGLISLLFAVLAAAIVTGRSNVEPVPDLAPAPAWRVAPGNVTQQAGPTGGHDRTAPDESAREAVEIELPDPALSAAGTTFEERTPPSIPRIPPVASFRGHIEPDTMEARHDQSGSSIH